LCFVEWLQYDDYGQELRIDLRALKALEFEAILPVDDINRELTCNQCIMPDGGLDVWSLVALTITGSDRNSNDLTVNPHQTCSRDNVEAAVRAQSQVRNQGMVPGDP
jgi:hypothetical protein